MLSYEADLLLRMLKQALDKDVYVSQAVVEMLVGVLVVSQVEKEQIAEQVCDGKERVIGGSLRNMLYVLRGKV